ncbi:Ferrichrome receptor FcuA precursor [Acinetobacter stercoris]|uniref:Ferrichrome receptor FcuA n=2 Tax=Acinetobacter stercoris TaxID=2126983 RepID=A0A2U3MYS7_9GAMM|nr:Ferrichrome receptor FcuA precursor [Acinetobacter stercoris]
MIIIIIIINLKFTVMGNLSKKALVKAISCVMLSGGASQVLWAEETSSLPTIILHAEEDNKKADATGTYVKQTKLGALGNKEILDTPFSVQSYSQKVIQDQQATTVGDVLKNDAGIRVTTNQGHLNENFKLRGFDVNHEDMSYNGLFGVAPYGRVPTEFLESVTVLKGPNALVAGVAPTGSVGGVIIANSKRADKELTQLSASMEEKGYYQSGFDISRRFGSEKEFGVRVNGTYGDGEHYIDGMNDRHISGALAADYTTDKLKLNFDSYVIRDNRDGGSPAMVSMQNLTNVIKAPKGDINHFRHLEGYTNSRFAGLTGEYQLNPDFKVFAGAGYIEKEYSGHLFGTRMILTNAQGDATSQYYRVGSKEKNTAANIGFEGKFDTGAIKHTLGLRADYLKRKYSQHEGRGATPVDFPTNLYDPSNGGHMPYSYPKISPLGDNDYTSYTLTDQLSMLDDKLQLIIGARYQNIDTINFQKKNTKGQYISYEEDKISPSLGIVLKPFGENLSFYASYVEGLTEGATLTDQSYVNDVNFGTTFAPYQTKQYEIGTKYQTDSWLHTLAIYQIEKPALMTTKFAVADANKKTQITTDDAEARSRGVEWSFSGKVMDDLNVIGNLAYIDSKYTKNTVALKNKNVYGVPDFTASLGLDYAIPMLEGLNINTRLSYVGEQYLNNANTLKLPDFTIWDLGARYKTKIGGVNTTFLANIDNVTNKKYWEGVFNDNYAIVGAARSYKLGVSFDF